jgi:hypothetical protein
MGEHEGTHYMQLNEVVFLAQIEDGKEVRRLLVDSEFVGNS